MIDSSTELARERSREAADPTLMACIRTALALGFGVGKVIRLSPRRQAARASDPIRSMLSFGASFIVLGTLSLLEAVVQHARVLPRIHRRVCGRTKDFIGRQVAADKLFFV
jgi:putative membrane protein